MTVTRNNGKASTDAKGNTNPGENSTDGKITATPAATVTEANDTGTQAGTGTDSNEAAISAKTGAEAKETGTQEQYISNLPAQVKKASIEEKLQRFEELEQLKERREQVIEGLENLRGFFISTTGGASVVMTDSRNKRLQVSHPIAIEAMVKSATARMEEELATIEEKFTL